ncbi:MAG: helix-turn-helix transcriptional regulator [Clostridia bacterium]|nr:helix-turn-helix transcriptional regulator [Clostridia bacterium]
MFIFAVIAYSFTIHSVNIENERAADTILSQTSDYIDGCISRSINTMFTMAESSSIKNLGIKNNTVTEQYAKINANEYMSTMVTHAKNTVIAAINFENNIVISSKGSMYPEFFAESIGIGYDALNELTGSALKKQNGVVSFTLSEDKGTVIMCTCSKSLSSTPIFPIVTIPVRSMLANTSSVITVAIDDDVLYSNVPDKQGLSKTYSITTHTYGFPAEIVYSYAISGISYHSRLILMLVLISLLTIIILAGSLVIIYKMTKKTYSPIADLLNLFDADRRERRGNEIDFIKNEFLSLTKSRNSFEEKAELVSIQNLIYGMSDEDETDALKVKYGLEDSDYFVCSVIELREKSDFLRSDIHAFFYRAAAEKIISCFSEEKFVKLIGIDGMRYSLIVSTHQYNSFKNKLHHLLLGLNNEMKLELIASIGSYEKGIQNIRKSFSNAMRVAENRIFGMKYNTICTFEDSMALNENSIYYPFETEVAYIDSVSSCRRDNAARLIRTLIEANFEHKFFTRNQFAQFIMMATNTINRVLSVISRTSAEIFGDDVIIYLELKSCSEPAGLQNKLIELTDVLIDFIAQMQSASDNNLRQEMLQFISDNYSRDISLSDLAENVNFSVEYTSRQFKLLVGQNFKEYLMRYRYDEAIRLIEANPGIKVMELAGSVGCTSATLSRIFTKFSGMSPSDYIKHINGKD